MSMNSKQRWMGGVVLLGGGDLLAALLLKGKEEIHQKQTQVAPTEQVQQQSAPVQLQPLTVDVATEKRLLEEQKRAREKAVAEQEAKAAEFLRMQQQAEAEAARKAAEEYAAMNARRGVTAQEGADIPPELVQDEKAKAQVNPPANSTNQNKVEPALNQQQKQKADAEKKLVEQKRLAEQQRKDAELEKKVAEDKKLKLQAEAKQKAEAMQLEATKKKAEADKKKLELDKKKAEADKKAAEDKKHKLEEDAKKKAEADKARALLEDGDKQWMVQVALAANEANADALASKLRAKGYKVTKSQTSKGIRIMVGPSKDRESADAARKKITTDVSLGMKSAWVIDWVPLEQR